MPSALKRQPNAADGVGGGEPFDNGGDVVGEGSSWNDTAGSPHQSFHTQQDSSAMQTSQLSQVAFAVCIHRARDLPLFCACSLLPVSFLPWPVVFLP